MEPSSDYYAALKATRELHATTKKFNGRFLFRYIPDLEPLLRDRDCATVLDYGCGKAIQWERFIPGTTTFLADYLGVRVTKYDPGTVRFAAEPEGQFDAVICTQVLGSVPISDLPWVIDRMYGFATKLVFIGERIKPVRKQVHAHMADKMPHEKPHEWWLEQLSARPRPEGVEVYLRTFDNIRDQNAITAL